MRLLPYALTSLMVCVGSANDAAQAESGPKGISCNGFDSAFRNGSYELGVGRVRLHDGKACVVDRPDGPCEWSVELLSLGRWGSGGRFLMAGINADHLTGSGAWHSLFVYECRAAVYQQVFTTSFLYGARIELGPNADFVLTSGKWEANDPVCCPSSERRAHYVWNPQRQTFVVSETQVTPKKR